MKKFFLISGFFFAGLVLLSSCVKDNFDLDRLSTEMELEPALAAPLLFGSFNMDDLVGVMDTIDYSLKDEEGERYYLVYPDTVYSLSDTVGFSTGLEEDRVTSLDLYIKSRNELAIRMEMQIYMVDENNVVLDSVYDGQGLILGPAEIDSDGELLEATENENSSSFDEEKIGRLDDIAYLWVKAGMHAAKGEEDFVKIYAKYSLSYEISLSLTTRINIGDQN